MAKFCGNCGAQMDDNAVVCGSCGASLGGEEKAGSAELVQKFKIDDPEKKNKIKKIAVIGAAAIAVIVVISVLVSVIVNNTGYRGCLKKTMKAFESSESNVLDDLTSGIIIELDAENEKNYKEYYGDEYAEEHTSDFKKHYIESEVESAKEEFENKCGHKYKVSYKVDEYFELEGKKLKNFAKELGDGEEDALDSAEKIQVAEVTVTAKKDKKTKKCKVQVVMSKEDGKWKVLSIVDKGTF